MEFSGPDPGERKTANRYAKGNTTKGQIRMHFDNRLRDAQVGDGACKNAALPQNPSGAKQLSAFTAAVVLHERRHNHGFNHPDKPDRTPGIGYASPLPHVAFHSALDAAKANRGKLKNSSLPLLKVKATDT